MTSADDDVRRIRVIWNERAGRKAALTVNGIDEAGLRSLMERHGLGSELHVVIDAESVAEAVRSAREAGYHLVVAAGGDGTIGMVAEQLLGGDTALGILPLGSVMNVPRMLGVPRDLDEAASGLTRWPVRRVDAGIGRDRVFFEAGSVGVSATVFRHVQRAADGDLRGLPAAVRSAWRFRPARVRITLDGREVRHRALMVMVANGPYAGAAFTVAPAARVDDGRFDVQVFRHFSKLDLLRHFLAIARGRRAYSPHISSYRAAAVRVDADRPLPCRADGDDLGTTPITFRIARQALPVVAPPEAGAPWAADDERTG
jgi:diacylglycerol kinase (ATP)